MIYKVRKLPFLTCFITLFLCILRPPQSIFYHKDVPRGATYSFCFSIPRFFLVSRLFPFFFRFFAPLLSHSGAFSFFFPLLRPTFFSLWGFFLLFSAFSPRFFLAPGLFPSFFRFFAPLFSHSGAFSFFFPLFRPTSFSCRGYFLSFSAFSPRFLIIPGLFSSLFLSFAPHTTWQKKSPHSASTQSYHFLLRHKAVRDPAAY